MKAHNTKKINKKRKLPLEMPSKKAGDFHVLTSLQAKAETDGVFLFPQAIQGWKKQFRRILDFKQTIPVTLLPRRLFPHGQTGIFP
ncbi:hypothetical protein [Desulfoluna butyratoxydans]|uniref:hypothetical protein n=1 Tax=Desulfoluna butyratoxydans TaxID=231438 RepID=UPI0015D0D1F1|nr:hypothetical protein [Desulfoluna butyratoxydans]